MKKVDSDLEKEIEEINSKKQIITDKTTRYGNEKLVRCSKCGQYMRISARCCTHCGELNYLNQRNDQIKPIFFLGKKLKAKEDAKKAREEEKYYAGIDGKGRTKKQRIYLYTKRLTALCIIIFLAIAILNIQDIYRFIADFRAKSYLNQVNKIITQFDNDVKNNVCELSTSDDGSIYFSFYESPDFFKTSISLYTFDYFHGFIRITDNGNGEYNYYLSISDGKYGFEDVLYNDDLDISVVKKLNEDIRVPASSVTCK